MTTKRSADGESPSTSATFLPQFRRSRRASIVSLSSTSQIDKDALADTLDQIHSTASQSGTLTTFNEYTPPPTSSAGTEAKGITGDLQGGLSGLYSRLRASVGNVRDIVGAVGDANIDDDVSTKGSHSTTTSPAPSRHNNETAKRVGDTLSSGGEGSCVPEANIHIREGEAGGLNIRERAWKSRPSNVSVGGTALTSRGSSSSNVALRSPVPLPPAAAVASPAVAEVSVNVVKGRDISDQQAEEVRSESRANVKASSGLPAESQLLNAGELPKVGNLQSRNTSNAEVGTSSSAPSKSIASASGHVTPSETSKRDFGKQHNLHAAHAIPLEVSQDKTNSRAASNLDVQNATKTQNGSSEPTLQNATSHQLSETIIQGPDPNGSNLKATPDIDRLSGGSQKSAYQHIEIPLPKAIEVTLSSRARTPDVSLTRASSSNTATTLIHASEPRPAELGQGAVKEHSGRTQARYRQSTNIALPHAKSKVLNREYWMRDENAKDCFYCGDPFSTFRRKHHCSKHRLSRPSFFHLCS